MAVLFTLLFMILYVVLPGAVIVVTARVILRLMRLSRRLGKVIAVLLSNLGWLLLTITAYLQTGGDAGLLDGFGAVFLFCFIGLISSLLYLIVWVQQPSEGEGEPKEEVRIEPRV